jgi:dihydrofolate reductase
VRPGGGVATVREFLDADLVDTMLIAVAPIECFLSWQGPFEITSGTLTK